MKFRISIVMILISVTFGIQIKASSAEDEITYNLYPISKAFSKTSNNLTTSSFLTMITRIETNTATGTVTFYSNEITPRCSNETADCESSFRKSAAFSAVLPACAGSVQNYCIASLKSKNSNLQFIDYSDGVFWNENAEFKLPAGYSTSIWSFNNRLFAATARLQRDQPIQGRDTRNLTVELSEIAQINAAKNDLEKNVSRQSLNISRLVWLDDPDLALKVSSSLYRKLVEGRKDAFEITAKIRVGDFVPKWNVGQMQNASINLSKSGTLNVVEVTGTSVEVPIPSVRVPLSQDRVFLEENPFLSSYLKSTQLERDIVPTFSDNGGALSRQSQLFNGISEKWNISSKGAPRTWRVESFANSWDICIQNSIGVVGSLFTNANSYPNSFPSRIGDSFDFLVRSTHYKDSIELNNGYYQLDVKQETVKCLLRSQYLPISAALSVVDELGQAKIATTSSGLRSGYFNLVASNFTYSAPSIRVKFETAKQASLKTLYCIKGKVTKKVTAVSPKCPSGYKKK